MVTSETAAGRCLELEAMAIAVQVLEPGPGVRQTDARMKRIQLVGRQPDAVVAHLPAEQSAVAARDDVDAAAADLAGRCRGAARSRRAAAARGSAPRASSASGSTSMLTLQTIAEARLFDLEILLEEVELRP